MRRPARHIAVVAPAGIHDPDRLAVSEALVRSWGHEIVHGPHLGARHRYMAGTRSERLADLRWALTAPGIDTVWFARGGFGTAHLLAGLELDRVDDRRVIGFSDATALLSPLAGLGRGTPIHGPVLHSLADHVDDESREGVRAMLVGVGTARLPGRWLAGPREVVEGPLLGGNLCVLASLAGTPWALRAAGGILLIEDVAEPPYKIDRHIEQLRASGALEGVRAVAVGELLGTRPPEGADWTLDELLIELLSPLGVPVLVDLPVGHGAHNQPFVLGRAARLDPEGLDVRLG